MTPLCRRSGRKGILFVFSSKMWTPLGLFLYISISSLTESSMYNLQNNGIKVLKSLHVSGAEECNLTCDDVSDQDGLECNWVVIEEKHNLCFYLHCPDIPICKGATVEDVKALQIGQSLSIKIFVSHLQRNKVINKRISRSDPQSPLKIAPALTTAATSASPPITTTTAVSPEFDSTARTKVSTEVGSITMTITTVSPAVTNTTTTTATTTVAPTVSTTISTEKVTLAVPSTSAKSATTVPTATAPTTNNSAINATEPTSMILTSSTEYTTQLPTTSLAEVSTFNESNVPMSTGQQTTPAPTTVNQTRPTPTTVNETMPAPTTVHQTKMTNESSTKPKSNSTESATFPQVISGTAKQVQTAATSPTPKLISKTPMLTVTPQLVQEATTLQKQGDGTNVSRSTPEAMPTSTVAGGASKPPEIKPRTTVPFSAGKNYVFPSEPAGALIKYLADTSSLIAVLIFGLLFFLMSIILFAQKAFESYKRKDYVQVDYLINGMYADSDM